MKIPADRSHGAGLAVVIVLVLASAGALASLWFAGGWRIERDWSGTEVRRGDRTSTALATLSDLGAGDEAKVSAVEDLAHQGSPEVVELLADLVASEASASLGSPKEWSLLALGVIAKGTDSGAGAAREQLRRVLAGSDTYASALAATHLAPLRDPVAHAWLEHATLGEEGGMSASEARELLATYYGASGSTPATP